MNDTTLKVNKTILTKHKCYTNGRKITPKGIMIHSVGVNQPDAKVFVNTWNTPSFTSACVHAFVDGNEDYTVYQTLPWNQRGWHCGGQANNTHIGIEMCESKYIQYTTGAEYEIDAEHLDEVLTVIERTYRTAVKLCAFLCDKYNLDPMGDGVIISHSEGAKRKVATSHADPEHLWELTSHCMDDFRKDVVLAMVETGTVEGSSDSETKKEKRYRIKIKNLKIRKGPGTNTAFTGKYTGAGIFTIVETTDGQGSNKGWGLLKAYQKNRNGWVSLDYCEEV